MFDFGAKPVVFASCRKSKTTVGLFVSNTGDRMVKTKVYPASELLPWESNILDGELELLMKLNVEEEPRLSGQLRAE
ncbi:hypothetical protein PUN28_002814 [Cardiocondyla obscurior]|uniref:Uncharacterized protein n=1 Tax=Cardiocondyla obscurior TaxID=286306 RepID=A0AAW2GW83_9HYME